MKLAPEHDAQIREIVKTVKCTHECPCYANSFKTVGRVQAVGDTGILECLEARGQWCGYGLCFGDAIFCFCPLRKFLADEGLG